VDNDNVTGFLKQSVDGKNAVACAIALAKGSQEFWLHFGDHLIGPSGDLRPVRMIENLVTGEKRYLEWNGARLRIDPQQDPALLFRCHA
jgi:starch synthase (maltosyl-transferring)